MKIAKTIFYAASCIALTILSVDVVFFNETVSKWLVGIAFINMAFKALEQLIDTIMIKKS